MSTKRKPANIRGEGKDHLGNSVSGKKTGPFCGVEGRTKTITPPPIRAKRKSAEKGGLKREKRGKLEKH